MTERKRKIALCGALCGLVCLLNLFFPLPDFIRCFAAGFAFSLLLLALLPGKALARLKQLKPWRHHGY